MNDIARTFLEAYANGKEVEGGWKYGKALQQSKLDYSDASLTRLDTLLSAIRVRAKPSRQDMLETEQGRNFCALIAYYIIDMAQRRTGAHVDWNTPQSILPVLPKGVQLPEAPYMRLIAHFPDQAGLYWPLMWVEAQVTGVGEQEKADHYLAEVVGQLESQGPAAWWTGMHALGRSASWQMMMAADGGAVMPLMLSSTAPTTWVALMGPMSNEDISQVMDRGLRRLDANPDKADWQVLAYDGYVELNGGRFDAVMVIMVTYGAPALQIKIAFPYRPAGAGHGFEILDPTLLEANIANEQVTMLNGALERGIQSINWAFGKSWNQLRRTMA